MSKQDKVKSPGMSMVAPVSLVTPFPTAVTPPEPAAPAAFAGVPQPSEPAPAPVSPHPGASGIPDDVQRRLLELAVERETMSVRLEEAQRARSELEARLNALATREEEIGSARAEADQALASITAERDMLAKQVGALQDEVLRLPEELKALQNSRAFRIMKAGPFLSMRQPLSTLLVIAGMGVATNLWEFSPLASSIYVGVGGLVLLVSAIQFWARHD